MQVSFFVLCSIEDGDLETECAHSEKRIRSCHLLCSQQLRNILLYWLYCAKFFTKWPFVLRTLKSRAFKLLTCCVNSCTQDNAVSEQGLLKHTIEISKFH